MLHVYLQLPLLQHYALNPDELFYYHIASGQSLSDVLRYSRFETHPPLGNIIRWGWMQFDRSIPGLRMLSILFCLGTAVMLYASAKRLAGTTAGLIAAYLSLFSYLPMELSALLRNYTMATFFIACFYYAYLRYREQHARCWLVVYVLFAVAAVCTQYIAVYVVLALAVTHLWQPYRPMKRFSADSKNWAIANAVVGAIFVAIFIANSSWMVAAYEMEYRHYVFAQTIWLRILNDLKMAFFLLHTSLEIFASSMWVWVSSVIACAVLAKAWIEKNTEPLIVLVVVLLVVLSELFGKTLVVWPRHFYFLSVPLILCFATVAGRMLVATYQNSARTKIAFYAAACLLIAMTITHPQRDTGNAEYIARFAEAEDLRDAVSAIDFRTGILIGKKLQLFNALDGADSFYAQYPMQETYRFIPVDFDGKKMLFDTSEGMFYTFANWQKNMQQIARDYDMRRYSYVYFINNRWSDPVLNLFAHCAALKPYVTRITPVESYPMLLRMRADVAFGMANKWQNLLQQCAANQVVY